MSELLRITGIAAFITVQIALAAAKLSHVIDLPWWAVLLPVEATAMAGLAIIGVITALTMLPPHRLDSVDEAGLTRKVTR